MKSLPNASIIFFISKINKIRDNLTAIQVQLLQLSASFENAVPCMNTFRMLSEEDVSTMVRKSPTKSCEADPIPTALIKEILSNIIPLLMAVVNKSLQTGIFPRRLKSSTSQTSIEENKFRSHRKKLQASLISPVHRQAHQKNCEQPVTRAHHQ